MSKGPMPTQSRSIQRVEEHSPMRYEVRVLRRSRRLLYAFSETLGRGTAIGDACKDAVEDGRAAILRWMGEDHGAGDVQGLSRTEEGESRTIIGTTKADGTTA